MAATQIDIMKIRQLLLLKSKNASNRVLAPIMLAKFKLRITDNTIYLFCYLWSQILEPDFAAKCFNLHIRNLGNTGNTGDL